jgi:ketosteroid isomerase-like protein
MPRDNLSADQQRYRSQAFAGSNQALNEFRTGWQNDDAAAVAGMFEPNAVLVLPGRNSIQGSRTIRTELPAYLAQVGGLALSFVDGEVGDRMTYMFGQYHMASRAARGSVPEVGSYTAVLYQTGREWRIRALVFVPEAAEEEATTVEAPPLQLEDENAALREENAELRARLDRIEALLRGN